MQQPETPIHIDRHNANFNITLILGVAVAVLGFLQQGEGTPLIFLGLAFALYAWFTTPTQYIVFQDRLVIAYGRPRLRGVYFQQIDQVESLNLPFGTRLMLRLRRGRRIFIQPRDSEGFESQLLSALERYRSQHGQPEAPPDPAS